MLWLVVELVHLQEVVGQLDEWDAHVVSQLLVSNDTKALDVNSSAFVQLRLGPLGEGAPDNVVGGFADDCADGVRIASEVSLDSLIAK